MAGEVTMILRCPTCHAKHPVESFSEDEAARKLLVHAFSGTFPPSLLAYLSLFRTGKRDLAWSQALKLAEEAIELADPHRLEAALSATVESMRAKREEGQFKPLKNHNYLKKVIADTHVGAALAPPAVQGAAGSAPTSKTARGIGRLMGRKSR